METLNSNFKLNHASGAGQARVSEDDLNNSHELLQYSQSVASIRCIMEGENEEEDYTERQDSEIDSDSEDEEKDVIIEDNEIDSDNEADNEIINSEDESNDEIDSDDEMQMEMLSTAGNLMVKPRNPFSQPQKQMMVQELESDDDDSDFQEDGKDYDDTTTSSLFLSNSEYSYSFYNSDATRSNSHSSSFYRDYDGDSKPILKQLTVEPLKPGSRFRNHDDGSPPRRHFRRNKSERGFSSKSERCVRSFALHENDLSKSERGLRSVHSSLHHRDDNNYNATTNPQYRDMSSPPSSNQYEGSHSNHSLDSQMSQPRHPCRRYSLTMNQSDRGLKVRGTLQPDDLSSSEWELRSTSIHHRPKRALSMGHTVVGTSYHHDDFNRTERGLRTIGADMSRSERGLRTCGGPDIMSRSRSERGFRTVGGGLGGAPRRGGPRRRHLVPHGDSAGCQSSFSSSSSWRRTELPQNHNAVMESEIDEEENNRQYQGETDNESENNKKDKPALNLLVSIQPEKDNNDTTSQDDDNDESPQDNTPQEQYPGPSSSNTANYLQLLQSNIPHDARVHGLSPLNHQKGAFKSVAARLFAERTKMYSSSCASHPREAGSHTAPFSMFLEPSTSQQPLQKQKSIPESDSLTPDIQEAVGQNYIAQSLEMDTRNETPTAAVSPTPSTASSTVQELVQDYHMLADRLKSLVDSVRIYHQANQELINAREEFMKDCDVQCRDAAREMGRPFKIHHPTSSNTDVKYEIDDTWRSRARVRQWFSKIKHHQRVTHVEEENTSDSEKSRESSSTAQSPIIVREEDLVLQHQDVLDYVIEWEDIVRADVGQQIDILQKLKNEKDHYDRKVKKLQDRMKWLSFGKKPSPAETHDDEEHVGGGWGKAKLHRNLTKQSTAAQNYDVKEDEVLFLLKQVTQFGWKDLYPLVEATMYEEWRRLKEEQQSSFGGYMPLAITEVKRVLAEEAKKEDDKLSGIASKTLICPMAVPSASDDDAGGSNGSLCRNHSEEAFDPSKPLLVVDSRSPHGFVVWMTMLEHESDPCHPVLFDLQFIGAEKNDMDSPNRDKKSLVDASSLQKRYRLEESTPLLIHKGAVLFGTLCLAEYMNRFWKDQLPIIALHEPASVIPPSPLEEYNMNEFLQEHSKIESLWKDIVLCWLDWRDSTKTRGEVNAKARQEVQRFITTVEEVELAKFPGPYLCGHRFTLADIHLFAYLEHILLLLTMMEILDCQAESDSNNSDNSIRYGWLYGGSKLQRLSTWYKKVSSRPSALAMALEAGSSSIDVEAQAEEIDWRYIMKSRQGYLVEHYNPDQQDTTLLSTQ